MEITIHGLKKPGGDDFYNIQDHNDNTDIIEQHLSDTDIHVNSEDIAQITEADTLSQIDEFDTNNSMWGKVKKVISTLLSHISNVATGSALGHIKIGTGLQMNSGTASVKLTDSLETDDSTTALSANAGKRIYENLEYLVINNKITINATNTLSVSGYSENGIIVIRITAKQGIKGVLPLGKINDNNFCPRSVITGVPHMGNSDQDAGKIIAPAIEENGDITAWIKNELVTHETIMFIYPKKFL